MTKNIKMDKDTWDKMREIFGTKFILDKNIEITGKRKEPEKEDEQT